MLKQLILAAGLCLLFSIGVSAQDSPQPQAIWEYLDAQPPGPRSVIAYSLSGKPVRDEVPESLERQFRAWEKENFPSMLDYEVALLSLIKLQEDPTNYKNMDLFAKLYQQDALRQDGLDAVTGALLAYSASGLEITQSQPNAPNSLLDRVMAAQQRSGGFAASVGEEPNVAVTARAITALFPYQSGSDVKSTVGRALEWLDSQQNGDGTFSVKGLPSGSATAETLLAVSLYQPSPELFAKGQGILAALEYFRNSDGGYSEVLGGTSSAEMTELAVIARYTAGTGRFPYYAPERYPGYVESTPEPEKSSPWGTYGKFLIGFILVFSLVYVLLIITTKIGKFAEAKKLPGSLAAQAEKNSLQHSESGQQEENMQMHIPMQAEIPDFTDIPEQESEIGHPKEEKAEK